MDEFQMCYFCVNDLVVEIRSKNLFCILEVYNEAFKCIVEVFQ